MIIIKYETEEEAEQIIYEKQEDGFTLVEVTNITEGNFLGFQGSEWTPSIYPKPLEERINENTEYLIDVDYRLSIIELGLN
ncbi:hypothetical protein D3C76_1215400 [compost metagenome]